MIRWHWFLPPPIPGNKNAKEQLVLNELATRWQSPFTAISTAVAWPENNRLYTALVEQPGWWRTTNPSMLCLPACWDMFFPFRAKDGLIQISSMTQVRKRWNTKRIFFKKKNRSTGDRVFKQLKTCDVTWSEWSHVVQSEHSMSTNMAVTLN